MEKVDFSQTDAIQNFCGLAINSNKDVAKGLSQNVMAIFKH